MLAQHCAELLNYRRFCVKNEINNTIAGLLHCEAPWHPAVMRYHEEGHSQDDSEETREELHWIVQNGVPHQTLTVRMHPPSSALPTATDDGPWKGPVTQVEDPSGKPVTERSLEEACEWLLEEYGTLAQEQLNLLVGAQNEWKREILAAITKGPSATTSTKERLATPKPDVVHAPAATRPTVSLSPALAEQPATHKPRHFAFEDAESPVETYPSSTPSLTPVISDIPPPAALSVLTSLTQFEIGDAVEFTLDERTVWGEIIALQNAENTATVQLIPSAEEMTVSQGQLLPERASERCGCVALGPSLPPVSGVDEIGLEAASATGPVTLATFVSLRQRLEQGAISADELRRVFVPCYAARSVFCAMLVQRLNRSELQSLAGALRCLDAVGRATNDARAPLLSSLAGNLHVEQTPCLEVGSRFL